MKNYVNEISKVMFDYDIEGLIFDEMYQQDEYIAEAKAIANQITDNMSVEGLALIMRDIFDYYFLPNHNTTQFVNIAEEILKLIF